MIEIRDGSRLLSKPLQSVLIFRNFSRQDLERDRPAQLRRVLRQIYFPHSARADFGNDAVMSNDLVGGDAFAQILVLRVVCSEPPRDGGSNVARSFKAGSELSPIVCRRKAGLNSRTATRLYANKQFALPGGGPDLVWGIR